MRKLVAPAVVAVALVASGNVNAAEKWGDFSFTVAERFGRLVMPSPEVGKSGGNLTGSGFELRFLMPIDWGAYYRLTTSATNNKDRFDWNQTELAFGVSKRIVRFGSPNFIGVRGQLRIDMGMAYTRVGTNETCTTSYSPLATTCTTSALRPMNASGEAVGLDLRLAGDVGLGPIAVGADLGLTGYRRFSAGDNSLSPPGWFAAATALVKVGIAIPFT